MKMYDLRSMCELYAYKHKSDNIYLILQDYVIDSRIDRDDLNEKIILELGERKCYWRHTELLKAAIENWFKTHEYNIGKLLDTVEFEYNPIYNKDYYEDFISNKDKDRTQSEDNTETSNTINSNTTTNNSTSTNEISAYDSGSYQPQDKNTSTSTEQSNSTSNTTDIEDKDLAEKVKENLGTKLHHYGKESDESYADLIEDERRLVLFNIYDWIIQQLDSELLIGVFF